MLNISSSSICKNCLTNSKKIEGLSTVLDEFSMGDLSARCAESGDKEIDKLGNKLNSIFSEFQEIVNGCFEIAQSGSTDSANLHSSTENLFQISTDLGEHVESVKHSVELLETSLNHISSTTDKANDVAKISVEKTMTSQSTLHDMLNAIKNIARSSDEIFLIISLIENISRKANILAINAAIQAAKSGKHGVGFAVIAKEMRFLSIDTSKAIKNISNLIITVKESIKAGVELSDKTEMALKEIIDSIKQNVNETSEITEVCSAGISRSKEAFQCLKDTNAIAKETQTSSKLMNNSFQKFSTKFDSLEALVFKYYKI